MVSTTWLWRWLPDAPEKLAKIEWILAGLLALSIILSGVLGYLLWHVSGHRGQLETRRSQQELDETRRELSQAQNTAAADRARTREELADAQRRAAKLEARQRPRRLTDAQQAELLRRLPKGEGRMITVKTVIGDGEGRDYGLDFIRVLEAAGWQTHFVAHNWDFRGVFILVSEKDDPPSEAGLMLDAFRAAGIDAKETSAVFVKAGRFELFVGRKPE